MTLDAQLLTIISFGFIIEIGVNIFNAYVARRTHQIVNSQRSSMLRVIALQARRIADDHPDDLRAQTDARLAESDSRSSDERNQHQ
jgi:hypothetical protein